MVDDGVARVSEQPSCVRSRRQGLLLDDGDLNRVLAEETAGLPGDEAPALAQFDHAVAWARWSAAGLAWAPDPRLEPVDLTPACLLDLRVFTTGWELHLWREGETFALRLRVDGTEREPDVTRVLDEVQYLWGTRVASASGDWLELEEGGRGMRLWVPWPAHKPQPLLPLALGVRSYLGTDEYGLVDVVDARLTGLFPRGGGPAAIMSGVAADAGASAPAMPVSRVPPGESTVATGEGVSAP